MKEALVDVSVLLIFFNRPEPFSQVFEQVKKARPSRLFLYQDGPRNDNDLPGIEDCRKIAAEIDWDCEVHKFFQEKNQGCDPSGYLADKWAFSLTDKCIILEDDCVPSLSFFGFCKEMLDKYENDERIWMISGFNHEEITKNVDNDYFFTEFMSIWGWATWKRVIDTWDVNYNVLKEKNSKELLWSIIRNRGYRKNFFKLCQQHIDSGKAHFETLLLSSMLLNSGLSIMPKFNMVNNIGVTDNSTHFSGSVKLLPKRLRRIFTMPRYEISFPLKYPKYVIANTEHLKNVYKINAWDHPWIKICRSFEELFINLRYGNFKNILRSLRNRINKFFCA
ncbi:MAG: hemolysin activation protein [Muribaculaceae bacterium]|nr:hemolysin activation protein [Muribaculaceae bacterium]